MLKTNSMATKELGDRGEELACEYLVKNGYKILGRNYRITFGEIDIIAVKKFTLLNKIHRILIPRRRDYSTGGRLFADKTIHFVEVKTLSGNDNIYPEEHVDRKKQIKLKQLAEIWLSKNKYPQDIPYQIDIVAVSFISDKPEIKFFENIVAD